MSNFCKLELMPSCSEPHPPTTYCKITDPEYYLILDLIHVS